MDSTSTVSDTKAMILGMSPKLQPGRWIFDTVPDGCSTPLEAIASFREMEGTSVIVPVNDQTSELVMSWITLEVYSSLEGVGLTAAVSTHLAKANIPCNVVAARHHDHVFVPERKTKEALDVLTALSKGSAN